ncbi:PVC-type heme-binding CxxCH protein [Spirosoma luteolum]
MCLLPRSIALFPLVLTAAGLLALIPLRAPAPGLADGPSLLLPPDLEATLWAESPLMNRPLGMDVDARGRVWITESGPDPAEPGSASAGRVVILTDRNNDGRADTRTVFAQEARLRSPEGIAVLGTKVLVASTPDLLQYTDENGDDVVDQGEALLTGFGGAGKTNGLHQISTGPSGMYYLTVGDGGPHSVMDRDGWNLQAGNGTRAVENAQGRVSTDGRQWLGGLTMQVRPDGSGLRVLAHNFQNSQAVAIDSYGNLWQQDGPTAVQAGHIGWVMEGGNAGFYQRDGAMGNAQESRPGVMPVGERLPAARPTDLIMYEGDQLGTAYRGVLLAADAAQGRVTAYKPEISGAGYRLNPIEFVTTEAGAAASFQPHALAIGPDGAVYIAAWDGDTGRIYRITPKGRSLRLPTLDLRTTGGQVQALMSPAPHIRVQAVDALRRQGDDAVEALSGLLNSLNAYQRARAIFALALLGPAGQFEVEGQLKSADAQTRVVALRALRSITPENSKSNPALTASQQVLLPLLGNLSIDQSVAVRREVAVAVRDMPYDDCRRILLNLVQGYDGQDAFYLNAISEAADGKENELYGDLLPALGPDPLAWSPRNASVVWALHPSQAIEPLKRRANAESLPTEARLLALSTLEAIGTDGAAAAVAELSRSTDKAVAAKAASWVNRSRQPVAARPARQPAKNAVPSGNRPSAERPAENRPVSPAPVRTSEAQPTDATDWADEQAVLLSKTKTYNEKYDVIRVMARRYDGAETMTRLIAGGGLSNAMQRLIVTTLGKSTDPAIRALAGTVTVTPPKPTAPAPVVAESTAVAPPARPVATPRPVSEASRPTPADPVVTDKSTVSAVSGTRPVRAAVDEVLALTGNASTGQQLFRTSCARCHRIGQQGVDVGPSLTSLPQPGDPQALVESMLYPAARTTAGYEPWLIATASGQTFYGFLLSDGPQTVVVKGVTGQKHTIQTSAITNRRQLGNSLMPSAQTLKLSPQQVADITAYLLRL